MLSLSVELGLDPSQQLTNVSNSIFKQIHFTFIVVKTRD